MSYWVTLNKERTRQKKRRTHPPTDGEASEAHTKFTLGSPQLSSPVALGTYADTKYLCYHVLGEKIVTFLPVPLFPGREKKKARAMFSIVPPKL